MYPDPALLTRFHLLYFVLAFAASFGLISYLVQKSKLRFSQEKKVYFAGAVLLALTVLVAAFSLSQYLFLLSGLAGAGLIVLLFGVADEEAGLAWWQQLLGQALAAGVLVAFGWQISHVTNLFGEGVLFLGPVLSLLASIFWLVLLVNAVNWLDGIDGQATGVNLVAVLSLAVVSLLPSVQDSLTLNLAVGLAGVLLAFWLFNLAPAKIYLGTVGSWWLGLLLGALAIVGGGKVVTTMLILTIPVIDFLLVVGQRLIKKRKPWQGDEETHLHHKLLAQGWNHNQITFGAMSVTFLLAVAAIRGQTSSKAILFLAAGLTLLVFSAILDRWKKKI